MKKKALIISLSVVVVILSLILYIFYDTSPKQIKNEKIGTIYTFGEITFDLKSDKFKENQEMKDVMKENTTSTEVIAYLNEEDKSWFTVQKAPPEDTDIAKYFEEDFLSFKNPIRHYKYEFEEPKRIESETPIKRIKIDSYTGDNKQFILERQYQSDNITIYALQAKINDYYYLIIASSFCKDDVFEFMRTVNIK